MIGVPDLSQLKRRKPQPLAEGEQLQIVFTVDNTGNVNALIPPGLSLGAIGAVILILQRHAHAILNSQGVEG
jgi:hypothetical protein